MPEHFANHNALSSWIWMVAIVLVLVAYWVAVVWQYRAGCAWSIWRTIGFTVSMCLLIIAMSPSVAKWGHHDLQGHMVQHLLMGMFAPLGLVLAAPATLALRTLPVHTARQVATILRNRWFHNVSHPVTALVLNIGGMYVLYLTPLYAFMHSHSYVHHLVHVHFLAVGYLFTWAIAGPDPAPNRPGMGTRVAVLFVSIATHAYLSKLMYAYGWPKDTMHSIGEIRVAAKLMYYGGDVAELLLAVALFATWYQKRIRFYRQSKKTASM